MSANFGIAELLSLAFQMPRMPVWRYCTATPENIQRLIKEVQPFKGESEILGIQLFPKPGQKMAAWFFSDKKTLNRYLADELKESDLLKIDDQIASCGNSRQSKNDGPEKKQRQ